MKISVKKKLSVILMMSHGFNFNTVPAIFLFRFKYRKKLTKLVKQKGYGYAEKKPFLSSVYYKVNESILYQ